MENEDISIEEIIDYGRDLLSENNLQKAHTYFIEWDKETASWLDETFPNTGISGEWSSLSTSDLVFGNVYDDSSSVWSKFREGIVRRLAWLSKLPQNKPMIATTIGSHEPISNKVFIVHGHNEAIRDKVARFLDRLGLSPVILHEQPNQGRTIIEKFIYHSDVSYAVILLTGDDRGGSINDIPDKYKLRARQNVLFELGFFLGKLGRANVCALYEDGVEIPSDYNGVLFIPVDLSGNWQLRLSKELKTAGLNIDLNALV